MGNHTSLISDALYHSNQTFRSRIDQDISLPKISQRVLLGTLEAQNSGVNNVVAR